ncbi:MAG: c-type cytochrome biogenesis protein CcmI [Burkholderiaceae bacterium]|nr:c-type cytochrome biogenesis protein CcmI [Burkholderiaceae bacterium]
MDPTFLIIATVMALGAAAVVLLGLRRGGRPNVTRAALNAAVLKQRIGELALERERGLLSAEEFGVARDDLQRRALVEAVPDAPRTQMRTGRGQLVLAAVALPVLALPIYLEFGNPQLAAPAPAAVAAASDLAPAAGSLPPAMLAQLEAHVAASPKDARAWVLLGRARMDANQFAPAAVAYQRAIDAAPKVAKDPLVWCEYADAVGMSQGGTLAGKPRELIGRALDLDANAPCALEMAGSAAVEARDFRAAKDYWSRLLKQMPADSPQRLQLATALKRIEQQAKFALPGPDSPLRN